MIYSLSDIRQILGLSRQTRSCSSHVLSLLISRRLVLAALSNTVSYHVIETFGEKTSTFGGKAYIRVRVEAWPSQGASLSTGIVYVLVHKQLGV